MESLRVALGDRAYPIHLGAGIIGARALYAPHVGGGGVAVVTNDVVAPLHLPKVRAALGSAPIEVIVADGEQAKSWRGVEQVVDAPSQTSWARAPEAVHTSKAANKTAPNPLRTATSLTDASWPVARTCTGLDAPAIGSIIAQHNGRGNRMSRPLCV